MVIVIMKNERRDINMSNSNEFLDTLHENKQKMNKIESAKGTETQRKKPNKTHNNSKTA